MRQPAPQTNIQRSEEFFANPVLASTAPDYLSVISSPMDFSSMRRKVESNEYGHIAEFKADVQLVVDNAMTYNPPTSIYHLAASKLAVILVAIRQGYTNGTDGLNNPTAGNGARGGDVVRKGTTKALNAISDNVGSNDLMNMAEKDLKNRLTSRLPNCQLGYLDNKDGALALNILTGAEKSKITLGDFVKKLDKGNPGICTPAESRLCVDYPITYTNTGPFSSFAPQFDSTWATLSKRDSDLLTACYGDQANAAEAIALRQMVADSGDSILGIVDGFLDKLTDGEHSRTIKELEKGPVKANHSSPLNELLEDVKSLENIGLDLSFVNDLKVDLGLAPKPKLSVEQQLRKTGRMVTDLAGLNYNRLSNQPAVTLTDAAALSSVEVQLADNVLDEFGKEINGLNVKPADLVSSKVIHESLGLNDDDYDVLREFMVV
uniref:Bromo domain-containing protein n=1 Tax=Ditylenchus dipsaci TaxID=166011 RepID=A0A915E2U5_9BILA